MSTSLKIKLSTTGSEVVKAAIKNSNKRKSPTASEDSHNNGNNVEKAPDNSTSKFVIGGSGSSYLKELLGSSSNPQETICKFQEDFGWNSSMKKINYQPALQLLDFLGCQRSDLYSSVLTNLKTELLDFIAMASTSPQQLQKLLEETFPFIEFKELREIPIAILKKQTTTPNSFLLQLAANHQVMRTLPIDDLKRKIWLVAPEEFHDTMAKMMQTYVNRVHTVVVEGLEMEEKRRKKDPVLAKYSHVLGKCPDLFLASMTSIRHNLTSGKIRGCFYDNKKNDMYGIPFLGMFRRDCTMLQRDLATPMIRTDPVHKIAWILDSSIKVEKYLGDRDLVEILHTINKYRVGDAPVNKKSKKDVLPSDEVYELTNAPIVPTKGELNDLLTKFGKIDQSMIFAEPVPDDVPKYRDIISHPMDLSTMRNNVKKGKYTTVKLFNDDFLLMTENCLTFNPQTSIYYKEGKKLQKKGIEFITKTYPKFEGNVKPSDNANQKTSETKSSISSSDTIQEGDYSIEVLDIALLLVDPSVVNLLVRTLFKCLDECLQLAIFPIQSYKIRGIVQLMQIGNASSIYRMISKNRYHIRKPQITTLRSFLPLLIRDRVLNSVAHVDLLAPIKRIEDDGSSVSNWKSFVTSSSVLRTICEYYCVQAMSENNVSVYMPLLELFLLDDKVIQDSSFIKSVVSGFIACKGSFSSEMRSTVLDKFLFGQLQKTNKNNQVKYLKKRNSIKKQDIPEKKKSKKNKVISYPAPVLNSQFIRLLVELCNDSKCEIRNADIESYADNILQSLSNDNDQLQDLWDSSAFEPTRSYYEKLLVHLPNLSTKFKLSIEHSRSALKSTSTSK